MVNKLLERLKKNCKRKINVDESKNIPMGLNSLKSKVDKLDAHHLTTVSVDLKK